MGSMIVVVNDGKSVCDPAQLMWPSGSLHLQCLGSLRHFLGLKRDKMRKTRRNMSFICLLLH